MKKSLVALSIFAGLSASAQAAVYQLEELSTLDTAKHHFITDANNNGEVIGQVRGIYNLPIDVSYIDFTESIITRAYDDWEYRHFEQINKEITFTLDDIAGGNLNADALTFMLGFLSSNNGNENWQKVADVAAVNFTPSPAVEQVLLDQTSTDYDGYTRSVSNLYNAISEDGVRVGSGSAPYKKIEFTPSGENEAETYFVRDYRSRGVVVSPTGVVSTLEPVSALYGGTSMASDIVQRPDGGYYVVGSASIGVPVDRQEDYDERCDGEDEPVAVCVWRLENNASSNALNDLYDRRAILWTLDADLNTVETKDLGLGLVPDEDDGNSFLSMALAVNSQGLAVGYSHVRQFDSESRILTMPVLFQNGQVIELLNQEDDWRAGKAVAINEEGIITGYGSKRIDGRTTTKFFYHDLNTGQTVFPSDYFVSSSSVARDVNIHGVIIGEGEVDVVNSSSRRREGFIYNIGDDTVANINDLLPCYDIDGESNYPYNFAEATAIDDDGVIYGVATKSKEKLNARGEVEVDDSGKVLFESVAMPVKLSRIAGGEIEECPPEAAGSYERQSGSLGWLALLALPLLALRRRFK
ncbi:DUF3466 family protein [Pseudoalteromonas sp. T1lg10]|uniref:DUF3466 family protein n=1 Tax=Pseudoalteromonas sp. T1lg10 TaxID=2077093 RepID=UPI000CF6196E|nr:DUF3466 family protein [Pseudoalteromonas sp. T1lg10]